MKFKVTYWPGTANMPARAVALLAHDEQGRQYLNSIARTVIIDAPSYAAAQHITVQMYGDTSDGVLILPYEEPKEDTTAPPDVSSKEWLDWVLSHPKGGRKDSPPDPYDATEAAG